MKFIFKLLLSIFLILRTCATFSQCIGTEPILFLGNDTTLCNVTPLTLTAPAGYGYYTWSDNSTGTSMVVNSPGTYSVEVGTVLNNLVVNGNFESGNTGFTTSINGGTGGAYGTLSNPGEYAVTNNPNSVHMYFSSCSDHSVPGSKMMVVNGAGTPNSMVWSQTVTVTPNTDYQLGAWVMNVLTDPNVSDLQFFVNGVQIGPVFSTLPTGCTWSHFANSWNSGSATSAVLKIVNQNGINTGNDFALDDITFSPVCKKTDTITIGLSTPPTISATSTPATTCSGTPDGSITLTSTGVQFSFDGGTTWQASNIKTAVAPGTYSLVAKNGAGCTATSSIVVGGSALSPVLTLSSDVTICAGETTTLTASATGGTTFTYLWDDFPIGGTSQIVSPTGTKSYGVTVTNESGCSSGKYFILVSIAPPLTQSISSVSPSLCTGSPFGAITLNTTGATQYSFDGGTTWQGSNTISGVSAGVYTLMSKDTYGCTVSSSYSLIETTGLVSISVSPDVEICENGTTTLTATGAGGTTFIYHWNDFPSTTSTQIAAPISTKYYVVQAENQDGCLSPQDSILVSVLAPLSAQIAAPATVCPNATVALTVSSITGGQMPYSVAWTNGSVLLGVGNSINEIVTTSTVYTSVITDACGSSPLTLSTSVGMTEFEVPPFSVLTDRKCEPASFKLINTYDASLIASSNWLISNGNSYSNQNNVQLDGLSEGNYDVSLAISSVDGCIDTLKVANALSVYTNPTADFTYSPSKITQSNTKVSFTSTSVDATSFSWRIEDGSSHFSNQEDVTTMFPIDQVGKYEVLLVVSNDHQCTDSIRKIVEVIPEMNLFAPNCFTANGDHINDKWSVKLSGYDTKVFSLSVYNRWGELMWKSTDPAEGWDGTYKGKPAMEGMYNWTLVTKDPINDTKYYNKGQIALLRK